MLFRSSLDVLPPYSPDPRVDEGVADLLASVLSLAGPALGAEWGYAGSWESSPGPGPALDGRGLPPAAQWASWLSPALLARTRSAGWPTLSKNVEPLFPTPSIRWPEECPNT